MQVILRDEAKASRSPPLEGWLEGHSQCPPRGVPERPHRDSQTTLKMTMTVHPNHHATHSPTNHSCPTSRHSRTSQDFLGQHRPHHKDLQVLGTGHHDLPLGFLPAAAPREARFH